MPTRRDLLQVAGAAVALGGCTTPGAPDSSPTPVPTQPPGQAPTLTSAAFEDGAAIPRRYTCDGADVSPPLRVRDVPADTRAFALVVDDPDAGETPYVHWLVWDVPADRRRWPPGVPTTERVETLGDARQGTNSRGEIGYAGPCPPPGDSPHVYRFILHALDATLDLQAGAARDDLERRIEGSVLGRTTLRGTYDRE